ncbi:hypothetical protein CLV84_2603 [Neolewinella xylanilytica]|uniref:UbiA prenyltransferase family protein n=1 Tax=Neolewinella xylanilytica TaxID=1514080 RepID=A0A2S6I3G6_9BACT|nr:hypothetical protein [Neolewinella xylanilytica]PPK85700.1 hypothetical protein CLV84_2603 [Neolewinella xylanilytica]
MRNPVLNWLFYGHVWIALAAAALCWQSTYLDTGDRTVHAAHYFVFAATLGVYTLHRLLSFQRAGGQPDGRRYRVVASHPEASLIVGCGGLLLALTAVWYLPLSRFWPVVFAVPFTYFYLIPLYPGGPRLRDFPYLKGVWVAFAWTLMTQVFPILPDHLSAETLLRFCFTLSVALLFDTRDVALDRRQGVKTLAANHPRLNRRLALGLLLLCALVSLMVYPAPIGRRLAIAYGIGIGVGAFTGPDRGEDYYAVAVNGLLLLPPLILMR